MDGLLRDILKDKGAAMFTTTPQATVVDAVDEMNRRHVGALVVLDGARTIGIITERDVLKRVVGARRDPATTKVSEVMTREVVAVKPTIRVQDAMAVMTDKHCRHLPVLDGAQLLGLISIGDLTAWVGRNNEVEIQQLVDYVVGKYPA